MKINQIGSDNNDALLCHTDRPALGSHSGGDWFVPDGTKIYPATVPGFWRNRSPMVVRLLRIPDSDPAEGIHRCVIMDNTDKETTVAVGLYDGGGD